MRAIVIAAVMTAGLGLSSLSPALAAPANGIAINTAAETTRVAETVHWRRHWRSHRYHRHHRVCWWHRRHLHCAW